MSLHDFIENKDLALPAGKPYAAILGLTPSKGARSPTLWNKAFTGIGIDARMVPLDVTEANFPRLVEALKADSSFLGGAVTMPYKTQILSLLDEVDAEAQIAGAVNCFYRQGGKFIGTNTDGIAARESLRMNLGRNLEGAHVLLLGLGGAGSAVAAYLATALGLSGTLTLANRTPKALQDAVSRLSPFTQVKPFPGWPVTVADVKFDAIVNCTSLGFESPMQDKEGWFMPKFFSPLGRGPSSLRCLNREEAESSYLDRAKTEVAANVTESLTFLQNQKTALAFDIIYQPKQTLFLSLASVAGCRTLNGLTMNLEQAVIAFDRTTAAARMKTPGADKIRKFMEAN